MYLKKNEDSYLNGVKEKEAYDKIKWNFKTRFLAESVRVFHVVGILQKTS